MKFTFNSVHAIVGTVVVALVSLSLQGKAYAGITPSISAGPTTAVSGAQTWNFSGSDPNVTLSEGAIVSGSFGGQYTEPGVGSGDYLTVGSTDPLALTASLKFSTALNHFGVFWGTPDSYNTLKFYNAGSLLASFVTDTTVIPGGTQISGFLPLRTSEGARYIDFSTDAGTVFDRVDFESSQAAFEVDNISYTAVPTPAMLPAIVGFGLAALKRRKLAAQV
jgi:hypothetical protein